MIVQLAGPLQFADASRIVVPLKTPSAAGTLLVLAVVTTGRTAGLRISDNLAAALRWRQANADGGRALWYRVQSPVPGVTEIIIETCAALKITGRAVVAEVAGVSAGGAVQILSDLLLEAA